MNPVKNSLVCSFLLALCIVCLPCVAYAEQLSSENTQDEPVLTAASESDSTAALFPADDKVNCRVDKESVQSEDAMPKDGGAFIDEQAEFQPTLVAAPVSAASAEESDYFKPSEPKSTMHAASQMASVSNGVYTIVSATGSSKALDVPGGSSANAVGLQIYSQNSTAAQRWAIRALGGGLYEIVNAGSGKALDVSGARKADGITVQQYDRNSTNAQQWKIISTGSDRYKIVSALSDTYVLDVSGGSAVNGARVQIWSDNGTKAQRWSLVAAKVIDEGFYVMRNSKSDMALDVSGGSLNNGANVQQYTANGTPAQTYQFAYNSANGYYTITDLGSGKVLDVSGGSSSRGANVQQYAPNGSRAQQWAASKNADGTYSFQSAISGLALDVTGASSANGANVQVWDANGTVAQKWKLSSVSTWISEGAYTIIPAVNTGNAVDILGGSTDSGANVQAYASNATNAQRFFLRSMGSGCYAIQNPVSGKYLNASSKSSGGNVVLGTMQQQFKLVFGAGGITFQLKDDTSLVLDISGGSSSNGANVQLYKSNGTAAQKFVVRAANMLADGAYSIRYAANVDYVIDIPGASTADGIQANLYQSNGTAAQRFGLKCMATNAYQITASCSGKALQMVQSGGSYQLQQKDVSGAPSQQWVLVLGPDGTMQIAPKSNTGLRIDLSSGTVSNGNPIILYSSNNTAAQKWKLAPSRESITYDTLDLTLRRMAELQKTGGNNSGYTVEQLMDLLNPDKIEKTQLLDLRTFTNTTASQLNTFINSTSSGQSGLLNGLGSSFIAAAKQYGLNEVYLLSHAILESGWGTSTLARGYYYSGGYIDGAYYAAGTYYNFYGIGAYDSSPLSGGRKMAIINGWNSPTKAVAGAAQWIAHHYVYAGSYAQPTLYAMKWDYAQSNATGARGWHQYATDVKWPDSIARIVNQCYAAVGGNSNQAYVIPKYK